MQSRGVASRPCSVSARGAVQWRGTAAVRARRCGVAMRAGGVASATQVQQLLDAIGSTERGVATSEAAKAKIMAAVEELKHAGSGTTTTSAAALSATWKLLWTTEKESLWIIKNAGLFRTKAGDVFQVIDVDAGRLQNVVTFPPQGAFIVDSSIKVEGPQRTTFKFGSAKLKLPSRDLGLPPFGQGWFDTVYVDDNIRVAQDIRGDTLVVARDGPPRIFT
ncbi:MAG: plastid lipid associated protein [Monoraphidium minutum]|nr:MAG: plastid lipid associated protein [Monoraphidium minutum]